MWSLDALSLTLYADDSQLYVDSDAALVLNGLQWWLASGQSRMTMNKLELNPQKTEYLCTGNGRQWNKFLFIFSIELLGVETNLPISARNVGIILTKNFPSAHTYLQSASHAFTISRICGVFTVTLMWIAQKLFANALVSSSLDYCNTLFSGIVDADLTKLQHDWPVLRWRLLHLLTVFHCCIPFIGYQ